MDTKLKRLMLKAYAMPGIFMMVCTAVYAVVSMHFIRLAHYDHFSPMLTVASFGVLTATTVVTAVQMYRLILRQQLLTPSGRRATLFSTAAMILVMGVVCSRLIQIDAGRIDLLFAAENGDLKLVDRLLDRGVDIETQNGTGMTPLMRAAEFGQYDVVEELLRRGAKRDVRDGSGFTAVGVAADQGQAQTIELLCKHGADTNTPDSSGRTPLIWAAAFTNNDTIDALIRHGAKVNLQDGLGKTALMMAAGDKAELGSNGNARTLSALLAAGADPAITDLGGSTALSIATKARRTDLISLFASDRRNLSQMSHDPYSSEFKSSANLP